MLDIKTAFQRCGASSICESDNEYQESIPASQPREPEAPAAKRARPGAKTQKRAEPKPRSKKPNITEEIMTMLMPQVIQQVRPEAIEDVMQQWIEYEKPEVSMDNNQSTQGASSSASSNDRHSNLAKRHKKEYAKLNYRLKASGNSRAQEKWKQMNYASKQAWLDKFQMDPSMAWLEAETEMQTGSIRRTEGKVEPLTQAQLGGPLYLNSYEHARVIFESDLCKHLIIDHPCSALSAIGVKCIEWSTTWKSAADFFQDIAKVKATGSMGVDSYNKVREGMQTTDLDHGEPKKSPAKPKEMSKAQNQQKQERLEKQKTLAAAQTTVLKLTTTLSPSTLDPLIGRLGSRPWGAAVTPKITSLVEETKAIVRELHHKWSDGCLELKNNPGFDTSEIIEMTKQAQTKYNELDSTYLCDLRALK